MDQRKSPRYAITLNALVHPQSGRSWLCTIKDFCDFGMLLVEQEGTRSRRGMPGINPGEEVGIHFSVPVPGDRDQHFRLEGRIVRVMDSGVGINFPEGMDGDALMALAQNAAGEAKPKPPPKRERPARRSQEAEAAEAVEEEAGESAGAGGRNLTLRKKSAFLSGGLQPADSKRMTASLRKGVAQIVPEMTNALFKYMDSELLELAKDAKSNAEQSEYFAAMSNLEKAKKQVNQEFLNEVLDQIDDPRDLESIREERARENEERKKASAKRVKLSLVNTEVFEDWLAVANIISRSERSYERYLNELLSRMGHMVDAWGHSEANPLGIAVFCHAFDRAIQKVDLSKDIRQKVYTGYEAKCIPLFRKLYIASTKLLEESGLFPDIDEDYVSPAAAKSPAREEETSERKEEPEEAIEEEAPPEEIEDEVDEEDEEALDRAELERELMEELRRRRRERTRRGRPVQDRAVALREHTRSSPRVQENQRSSAISSMYNTVRDLIEEDDYGEEIEDAEYVEEDELAGLLSTIQAQSASRVSSGQRVPVREQLLNRLLGGEQPRRLPPKAQESLGVVENLIDSIEDDSLLSGSAKDWIRQLELTLDKVAVQQNDFLNEQDPHVSLEVINQLARLGGAESAAIQRNVDQIVGEITDNYDEDPEVFQQALTKLQPLVDRQNRAFTGNVQRAVKASEGQQTLLNAQRAVVDEMDKRLAGKQVPEVFMKLLMPGWRNLMVNTHLRQGQDSAAWRSHVRSLDQLMQQLDDSVDKSAPDYTPPEELITEIEQGLESISFEPGQRAPLINSLRQVLTTEEGRMSMPLVDLSDQTVAETLGLEQVDAREEIRKEILEEKQGDSDWHRCYDRIRHLHVGEWLEFKSDDKEPEIAIVAWASEDSSSFVFVNRRGVKTHELTAEELANLLFEGAVRIMEESDIPLTDRASHRMLQNMHNQLTHQATHDELTGLVNRKEFERLLEIALATSKRDEQHHLVAFMDLDQFKVINNTGGHDAGDRLLVDLGVKLRRSLPENVVLSRLGGDEFGVLIENCEADQAMDMVRGICTTIKDFRFEWKGDSFNLTTSCGVVEVSPDTESVTSILRGADSACYVAKEAGRDRIQIYETNDSEMEHRKGIREVVSQIDKALEDDRFVLNCQKIAPVFPEAGEHAHFEILLTVLDEDGKPMPPQDFIVAAETYNRMGAIDRWVIRNAFKFIADHSSKLEHLGAFSINISGNSLTEDDFMDFVLQQFNETRLPTSKICFEITETSAIGNLDDAIEFIEKMKVIGVEFSLDDFGTGLSSYSYLRNLPVDYLKIDGIFVKDIKTNPSDYAVVKSINEIGHFMGKKTIAEYVEDDEVLAILREIGVDFAQGFGIGKKIPIDQVLDD